jgi:hypothetical protein
MHTRLVRVCQVVTAGAALFAVLWACGRPPTQPSARDLAGTWEGTIQPPPEPALSARLVIAADGSAPVPTLTVDGTIYDASSSPGSVLTGTSFVLNVRSGQTLVTLTGQVNPPRTVMSGQVTGLSPGVRFFTFDRR